MTSIEPFDSWNGLMIPTNPIQLTLLTTYICFEKTVNRFGLNTNSMCLGFSRGVTGYGC